MEYIGVVRVCRHFATMRVYVKGKVCLCAVRVVVYLRFPSGGWPTLFLYEYAREYIDNVRVTVATNIFVP